MGKRQSNQSNLGLDLFVCFGGSAGGAYCYDLKVLLTEVLQVEVGFVLGGKLGSYSTRRQYRIRYRKGAFPLQGGLQ